VLIAERHRQAERLSPHGTKQTDKFTINLPPSLIKQFLRPKPQQLEKLLQRTEEQTLALNWKNPRSWKGGKKVRQKKTP